MTILVSSLFYCYYYYAKHYYKQQVEYLLNGKTPISINFKKWGFFLLGTTIINLFIYIVSSPEVVIILNLIPAIVCLCSLKKETRKIKKILKKGAT